MKHLFKILLMALLTSTLLGCILQAQPQKSARPAWIDNPRSVGDVVGLGQAGFHFDGKAAQRELATSRALDEIARQMGVTVNNIMVINQQHTGMGNNTNVAQTSEQSVKGKVVNAVVHDEWQEGDTLYVIMVGR